MAEYSGLLASKAIRKRQDLINKAVSAERRGHRLQTKGDLEGASKAFAKARYYQQMARYSAYRASKHGG